ncbi:mevalonate kinase [Candidatus Woesearchaeota archaeon]|nr:mevalonate kinase [Candidatus Woesearchaeota archaeon]
MQKTSACAKIILSGEHAVVYGKPGIALPVTNLQTVIKVEKADTFSFVADKELEEHEEKKLHDLYHFVSSSLKVKPMHKIHIQSNLPISSGLGSSASLTVALIRSLLVHHGYKLNDSKINLLAFEAEKIFHGTPSGIDNTVVALEKPVYYERGSIEILNLKFPLSFIIADTGIRSDTKKVVEDLRKRYEKDEVKHSAIHDKIEMVTRRARPALEQGHLVELGMLMLENHNLLKELKVSCSELDALVKAAIKAGAYGAKMAGAGRGGHIIALVDEPNRDEVFKALEDVSPRIIITEVK